MFIQTLFTKRSFICSGVLAFILALTAPGLMGQDTAGATSSTCTGGEGAASITLHGTVTDPSQAILPDATVIVECGSFRRLTQTNATGAYSLTLPPGSYRVRVEAAGFSVQILQESLLKSQTSKQQDIMLSVVPATTTVSVTANPDYVADNSNTAMKTNTPLIEAPQSVTVVTSMQMAARDVQSVDQAISYTAGSIPSLMETILASTGFSFGDFRRRKTASISMDWGQPRFISPTRSSPYLPTPCRASTFSRDRPRCCTAPMNRAAW